MRMSPIALVASFAFVAACSDAPTTPTKAAVLAGPSKTLGNGFPQGGHDYRLNIIGVPKDKSAAMDDNNGRRIFVQLQSTNEVTTPGGKNNQLAFSKVNHIYLCNSTNGENDISDPKCDNYWQTNFNQFGVLDANATDANGAIFALPDPCADADPTTACSPGYKIYARAHGKPGGNATVTLCADEANIINGGTDDIWCGANGINMEAKGGQKAINITDNLLSMTILVNEATDPGLAACLGDNKVGEELETVWLFDNCLENYFWNYDNNGLKLLELRFYSAS